MSQKGIESALSNPSHDDSFVWKMHVYNQKSSFQFRKMKLADLAWNFSKMCFHTVILKTLIFFLFKMKIYSIFFQQDNSRKFSDMCFS